jgi:phenylalanyl-tRNA synthetase beta chain
VIGIARDLATRWGRPVEPSRATLDVAASGTTLGTIDAELCRRLTVVALSNVSVVASPAKVVSRLEAAGMRSLNNVVDASNYVMLERGQPTHPYDASRVSGRQLGVRRARAGESLVTLDAVTRPLALAGRGTGRHGS